MMIMIPVNIAVKQVSTVLSSNIKQFKKNLLANNFKKFQNKHKKYIFLSRYGVTLSEFTFCGFPRFGGADRLGGGGPQEGDDAPDDGEREWRRHPARALQAVDRRRAGNEGCAKPLIIIHIIILYIFY